MPMTTTLLVLGRVPPELWNVLGTRLLPKLCSGNDLEINVDVRLTVDSVVAGDLKSDLQQVFEDLGLRDSFGVE